MSSADDLVRLQRHGDVVVLELNRPAKLNALSTAMESELLTALRSTAVTEARAVVFTGAGGVFSAGADTSELPTMSPARIAKYYRESGSVYDEIAKMPQPTIAAIAGYCVGGGFELSLACDFRVVDKTAVFMLPEVTIGILPSSGGLTRLVRMVGPAVTKQIVFLGRRMSAQNIQGFGLASELVDVGQALPAALALAKELCGQPPLALAWTKAAIDASAESSTAASLLIEQLAYAALNSVGEGDRRAH